MLADFHWIRPIWLLAIPVVLLLVFVLARAKLGAGRWQSVVDEELMPYVLARTPGQGVDHRWWLAALVGVIASVALAGPAWQRIEQPVFRAEQSMVIAVDLSRSMDAQDIAPSRIARAKLKILDILSQREGGETALIVYSANAFTVAPLTTDTDTIAALVNSVSTDIMPSRGSYPEVAIAKGQQLLQQAGVGVGEVLLITDGGSSTAAERAAEALRDAGFSLSILGVGTQEGAPIPRASGGFVTDNRGKIAVPRLESSGLRSLASVGGGRYAEISADNRDIEVLLSGEVAAVASQSDDRLATDRWREEGPWLLLLLLPLAALAFRRGWVLVAVIVVTPWPQTAAAMSWTDLWLNKNQQAAKALMNDDPGEAAALFEDSEWQAVAKYRAGEYEASAAAIAELNTARSYYNRGNAMAFAGNLDGAIESYETALLEEPGNEDAQYNLELVKSLQEQQQQAQENQGDDQQSTENPGGDGEQSDSEGDPDQQGAEGQSQSDSEEGEAGDRGEQELSEEQMQALQEELRQAAEAAENGEQPEQMSEAELAELRQQQEQQQAMEQWLRRIPDDPGGLLRRKFRYQYQRSGKDQDGNSVWPDNEVQPW